MAAAPLAAPALRTPANRMSNSITFSAIHLLSDTGASHSDFITTTQVQTVGATLSAGLDAGDTLWGSLDGGTSWTDISSKASGSTLAWSGAALLSGSHGIALKVSDGLGVDGAIASQAYTLDLSAPGVTITHGAAAPLKVGDTAQITFTFSEAPIGFAADDITTTGGTLGPLKATAGNPLEYTATFAPPPGANHTTATVSVTAGSYQDTAGNAGTGAASPAITYDTLVPVAALVGQPRFSQDSGSSGADLITRVASQTVSGNLSQPLAAMDTVRVSFDGGGTWAPAIVAGTTWSLDTVLTASGMLQVRVVDTAGNVGSETSTPYSLDQSTPTVSITSDVGTANGVTPAVISFTFSEAPVGFSSGNVAAAGGTMGPLAATSNPLVYTATFTPTTGVAAGNATIVVNGGYTDTAGNAGAGGSIPALLIDTVAPTAAAGGASFLTDTGKAGDLVTNVASQTISGNLSAPLVAGDRVQLSLDNGATWTPLTTSIGDASWSTNRTLSGSSTLVVRVADAAGNYSAPFSAAYAIDTMAPTATFSSTASALGYGQSAQITLTLSDPAALTLADIVVTGGAVSAFSGSGTRYTFTVTPPDGSKQPITASLGGSLFTDEAGNSNSAASPLILQVNTNPPPDTGTPPPATTIDGVAVTTAAGPQGATVTTIPVVPPGRTDTPGSASPLADIPLVQGADGHPILFVSVPAGVGLTAEGLASGSSGAAALAELGLRIERVTGPNSELTNAGNVFYATLGTNERLSVQIIKPTLGPGYDGSQPLVIQGSASAADGKQAVIIDASALPSGTVVQVDNVDFVAVVGSVRLVGGAGQNMVSGDASAQWMVLGPGNDILHGGAGNDTIGSEAGDDQVYGDAGDDTVFGGAGNDILSGGAGSDHLNGGTGFDLALQPGARADYTLYLESGGGVRLTHNTSGVSDWFVDVEQIRFETGPILTLTHSAAERAAAFLFQKWLGRDLTQGEGAVIKTLAGQSAEQVASAFAQLFPTQAAGKTAAQLLEGMASAGIVPVDVREVAAGGDAGNNTITPTLGLARYVDGGAGIDTVVVSATLAQTYVQHNANGSTTLQRLTDGAMVDMSNVERVKLSDTQLALDLSGHAGQAARLLGALGGPAALANKALVGEAIRALDAGMSPQALAAIGLTALGASTPAQVAQLLFTNVAGRPATSAELQPLVALLGQGLSASDAAVMVGNMEANATRIDLVGLINKGIEFV